MDGLEVLLNALDNLADMLTVSRLVSAALISWLGWSYGIEGWYLATTLLVYAWSSDVLDGEFARRSKSSIPTWIGKQDLYFDMAVAFGLLVFMTASHTSNLSARII